MAGFEAFDRDLRLATAGLTRDAIAKELAQFARQEVGKAVAAGASPHYDTYVNGRKDAPLESVVPPGPIVFEFVNWPIIINAAIEELRKRVRSKSGRYASSFIVIASGKLVVDYRSIPSEAEVIIVNAQPYTRKLDAGRAFGRRHFLNAYWALRRRFGEMFSIRNVYLDIKAGVHPLIPYRLQRGGKRKDRQIGMPITYPALVINTLI